jgi:tetratricopeptide (TPR) repeat protein
MKAYGDLSTDIAAELAMHFEQGRAYRRAIVCLRQAAKRDARRHANRESVGHLSRALKLVERLPEEERPVLRIDLLEERGLVLRSMGDMQRAAADFETMTDEARRNELIKREVSGLLSLSSALSWVDRERCLETVGRVLELSEQNEDEFEKADALGLCAYWNLLLDGWRDEDAKASYAAVQSANQSGDQAKIGLHSGRYSYFQSLRSDYIGAIESVERAVALHWESGNAFEYQLGQFFRAWAELHAGKLHEAFSTAQRGARLAGTNGHHQWAALFNLEMAWILVESGNFNGALAFCEPALGQAVLMDHSYSVLLGMMVAGRAHLGLGQRNEAIRYFSQAVSWLDKQRVLMDWIIRMPLSYGFGNCLLQIGELGMAKREARALVALASRPCERTYLALGRLLLSRIAEAEGDQATATKEFSLALEAVEGASLPLAERRINEPNAASAGFYQRVHQQRNERIPAHLSTGARRAAGFSF